MRTIFPSVFTVINLDSASLAGTATVVHPLREAGDWRLTVCHKEGRELAAVALRVRDEASLMQVAVDLNTAQQAGRSLYAGEPSAEHTLRTGGYIRLMSGKEGFFATLRRAASQETAWDSRRLQAGDLFAFLPLRPGRYTLANQLAAFECSVTVLYPDPRLNKGARPPQPEPVRLRAAGSLDMRDVTVVPAQGIVVEVEAPAHLTFILQEPDDGPAELAGWRAAQERESAPQVKV